MNSLAGLALACRTCGHIEAAEVRGYAWIPGSALAARRPLNQGRAGDTVGALSGDFQQVAVAFCSEFCAVRYKREHPKLRMTFFDKEDRECAG